MLFALEHVSGELYSGEDAAARPDDLARHLRCPDLDCDAVPIWRPGHGGRRPHWAHPAGTPRCGGAAVTDKHLLMQDVVAGVFPPGAADCEFRVEIPEHPLRTSERRIADVRGRLTGPTGTLSVCVECQHSRTNLQREEQRVLDHNIAGRPVLMVVSSDCIRVGDHGKARVDHWVLEWARRHGRQQVAAVDDDGELWWCWFQRERDRTGSQVLVERVPIRLGMASTCGTHRLGLTVDSTRPERATGAPDLLIAAFAWIPDGARATKSWPKVAHLQRHPLQPARISSCVVLGRGRQMFDPGAVVTGGFA